MEKQTFFEKYKASVISVGIMLLLLVVAVVCHLYGWKDAPFQFLAACLGAGVTVIITNLLLVEQTKQQAALQDKQIKAQGKLQEDNISFQDKLKREADEANEKRNKELQLRENKIKAYSEFVSSLYSLLGNSSEDKLDLEKIRMEIFSKLIFYIEPATLEGLLAISDEIHKAGATNKEKLFENLCSITSQLRFELFGAKDTDETVSPMIKIWNNFSFDHHVGKDQEGTPAFSVAPDFTFWHFNMWDSEQIESFRKGLYELALIEYDETWRTNLVQQVKCGDVAFLFRRGGWGYIGAFVVKGWRVIYNNEDGLHEVVYNGQKTVITDVETINRDIDRFDIYKSISNGATSCANLIVEPIAFDFDGVSYPGGVYRRTISRYDGDYARALLSRFLANKDKAYFNMLWEERDGQKVDVVKVDSNAQSFDKLVSDLNIKPAEKDSNGNWL